MPKSQYGKKSKRIKKSKPKRPSYAKKAGPKGIRL